MLSVAWEGTVSEGPRDKVSLMEIALTAKLNTLHILFATGILETSLHFSTGTRLVYANVCWLEGSCVHKFTVFRVKISHTYIFLRNKSLLY